MSNMLEAAVSLGRDGADCAGAASDHSCCCFERGSDKLGPLCDSSCLNFSILNYYSCCTGVSAAFAVKLFKSWINEKDINAVAVSLRKVNMDNRLMVSMTEITDLLLRPV